MDILEFKVQITSLFCCIHWNTFYWVGEHIHHVTTSSFHVPLFYFKILKADGGSPVGSKIYVFTDGQETPQTPPTISAVRDEVIASEAIVYGLLLIATSDDHDLVKLAYDTKGETCIYSETDGGSGYYECLNSIHAKSSNNLPLEV